MSERGPEIDLSKKSNPIPRDGVERGSNEDGTVDVFYYDPNVRPEPVLGDALETMPEAQRQKYQDLLDQLKSACDLGGEKKPSSVSDGQRVGALASLATFLATGSGVAVAETVSPSDAKAKNGTEIVSKIEGEIPSKTALDKMMAKASAGVSDVTPAAQPTPLGPEATPSLLDLVDEKYIEETRNMILDFDAPLPLERIKNCFEAWKIREFGPKEEELKKLGAKNEARIKFGARVLYAYDNPMILSSEGGLFEDYITREEIIDYVLIGKNKNVLLDSENNPVIWMVNMTDKMKKDFKKAFKKLEKSGAGNTYDALRDCGTCVCIADKLQSAKGASEALLVETGVVNINMDEENTKGFDLTNMFSSRLIVEPVGVVFYQLAESLKMYRLDEMSGSKWTNYCELVKDVIASEITSYMSGGFSLLTEGYFMQANYYANKDGLSIDSEFSQRLVQTVLGAVNIAGEDLLQK